MSNFFTSLFSKAAPVEVDRAVMKVIVDKPTTLNFSRRARFLTWTLEGKSPTLFVEAPGDIEPPVAWEFFLVHVDIPKGFHNYIGTVPVPAKDGSYMMLSLYVRRKKEK